MNAVMQGYESSLVGCAHCWHYHPNVTSPRPYDRCCHCGRIGPPATSSTPVHGPYIGFTVRAVPYVPQDSINRAPCFAAVSCVICGAYNDLVPTGRSFHCRGGCKDWRGDPLADLLALQELSEPVHFALYK